MNRHRKHVSDDRRSTVIGNLLQIVIGNLLQIVIGSTFPMNTPTGEHPRRGECASPKAGPPWGAAGFGSLEEGEERAQDPAGGCPPRGEATAREELTERNAMSQTRLCAWCGQDLTRYAVIVALHGGDPNHPRRRYCSPYCRGKAKQARKEAR